MKSITRNSDSSQRAAETAVYFSDDWFDPTQSWRARSGFIQAMVEGELDAALMRPRYGRCSRSWSGDAGESRTWVERLPRLGVLVDRGLRRPAWPDNVPTVLSSSAAGRARVAGESPYPLSRTVI